MPTIRRRNLLGAGLAGLAAPPARAAAITAAKEAAVPTLTLGALFPFSGPLSLIGDESFRGLDLATDERNARGGLLGRRVVLARGDAAEARTGAAEAQRLIDTVKVAAIFGTYDSAVALAASAVADRARTPYFELDALAEAVTGRGFRLLFRSGLHAATIGVLAVDTVADLLAPAWQVEPRSLRLMILHQDGIAGADIASAEQKRAAERGFLQAQRIAYAASTLDLAPIVQRLRGGGVEVVLHSGLLNDVLLFHRAMRQAGWRPRMVIGTGGGYALADTAEALGPAFEGVMSVGFAPYRISDVVAPGVAEVAAAYQRKYGAPPRSGHSLACFAGARVFFDAITRAGTLEGAKLRAAVLATVLPPGASVGGSGVAFDERGQNVRATAYLAQWQKGALVTVAPLPASVAPATTTLRG